MTPQLFSGMFPSKSFITLYDKNCYGGPMLSSFSNWLSVSFVYNEKLLFKDPLSHGPNVQAFAQN